MRNKIFLISFFILGIINSAFAQESPIHLSVNVANNHLWRGIEVTDGLVFTSDLSVTDPSGHYTFGFWNGTNTSGTYKEFNNYGRIAYSGFSFELWDTYNFSPGANYNNTEFFNYKADETGRFLDARLKYKFSGKFPLTFQWATVIFGRDRNTLNEHNLYSTYVYLEYPVYQKEDWNVDLGIGGAFVLNGDNNDANFYADQAGIVHATVKVSRDVNLFGHVVPIHAQGVFNPVMNRAFFQIGGTLFEF